MKISTRELGLLWTALAVVLIFGSYMWVDPQLKLLKENQAQLSVMERKKQRAEYEISRKDVYQDQLVAFRDSLPKHSADARVTSDLLKMIEKTARDNNLVLLKQQPDEERSLNDLYEISINCTWEGTLDALVRFLYAVQSKGAILDISLLTVAPKPSQAETLKGRFTVDCAYSREITADADIEGGADNL